jgi:hypothetical protein
MKGTELHTVAAATTGVLIIGHKAEFMVIEGTSGANLDTASIAAVHAGAAGEEPT